MAFIIGKKIGMSQYFGEDGKVTPVTLIEAGPCCVAQIKTEEGKDGYRALQIGFGEIKDSKIKKSQKQKAYRCLKEFRTDENTAKYKIGDKIDVSVFKEGEKIKVSGISKGKGFAGVIKKWNFNRGRATHGQKHQERSVGSVGCRFPQRVIKGKKMPGRMGSERTTLKNLKIVKIDKENNLIAVKGAVPGKKGTLLEIRAK